MEDLNSMLNNPDIVVSNETGIKLYEAFENAMHGATIMRLLRATHVISELRERKRMLDFSHPLHFQGISEMVSTENEDSTAWEKISVAEDNYQLIISEFLTREMKDHLTTFHATALLSVYLRSMELVTDFLHNDRSIPVSYLEQNLNRALNRLILLEQLEAFLLEKYQYKIYA